MLGRSIVAIDIGSSSIKAVEIGGMGNNRRMNRLGMEVLPPRVVEEGLILDHETLRDKIKELLKRLKITTFLSQAGIAISGSSVIIKRVTLAKSKDDPDFYEYLYHEAEQYLQYDVSDLYVDWVDLASGRGSSSVLLVGAKRDVVEEYMSLISSAGLKTAVVDCDALASINAVSHNINVQSGLVAVANIGHNSTQVSVLTNGDFAFTREISIGGNNYSEKIVEAMGLDLESAETLKITSSQGGREVSEECQNVLHEVNANLVGEIQATVDYYAQGEGVSGGDAASLQKVYLIGGSSKVLGLDMALQQAMQTPVAFVNPFQNVSVNSNKFPAQFLSQQGHMFGVAVGLGLRRVDDKGD